MVKYKTRIIMIMCLFFYVIAFSSCNSKVDSLRLRILSNSNSSHDIQEKEYIKNVIKEIYEENGIIDYTCLEQEILTVIIFI